MRHAGVLGMFSACLLPGSSLHLDSHARSIGWQSSSLGTVGQVQELWPCVSSYIFKDEVEGCFPESQKGSSRFIFETACGPCLSLSMPDIQALSKIPPKDLGRGMQHKYQSA